MEQKYSANTEATWSLVFSFSFSLYLKTFVPGYRQHCGNERFTWTESVQKNRFKTRALLTDSTEKILCRKVKRGGKVVVSIFSLSWVPLARGPSGDPLKRGLMSSCWSGAGVSTWRNHKFAVKFQIQSTFRLISDELPGPGADARPGPKHDHFSLKTRSGHTSASRTWGPARPRRSDSQHFC